MSGYFVTATGTDVGKTYVTAGIIRAARQAGRAAAAIKPIMSGYDPTWMHQSDAGILLGAMEKPVTPDNIAAISPWRFAAALSPDLAAQRENRTLNLHGVATFCQAALHAAAGPMLIEGVGGAMVPLDAAHTVRDWIAALDLPVILVAGTYLGSISHSLTTIEALTTHNIRIAHIVLSESRDAPISTSELAAVIGRFCHGVPVHIIPRNYNDQSFRELAEAV